MVAIITGVFAFKVGFIAGKSEFDKMVRDFYEEDTDKTVYRVMSGK